MKSISIAILALGLSACAPMNWARNPDPGFQKVGNPNSFEVDKQECLWKAQAYASNDPLSWPTMVAQCLRAKGWVPTKTSAIKSVGEGLGTTIAKGI